MVGVLTIDEVGVVVVILLPPPKPPPTTVPLFFRLLLLFPAAAAVVPDATGVPLVPPAELGCLEFIFATIVAVDGDDDLDDAL